MSSLFLHEHQNFKDLIEIVASKESIKDPSLVEKDYWLMHVLWSLKELDFRFQLKGGTSLSKGFACIHRFSEDIDLKIEPDERCGLDVHSGKNHDAEKHISSRRNYFDWICNFLKNKINGIVEVIRDEAFDDQSKYRSGGIRLKYQSHFTNTPGLKEGVLLEVGFAKTAPNQPRLISSWAYDHAIAGSGIPFKDNRAQNISCYEPRYTFVEKLQTVIRKFRLYKEGKTGANLPANFIRHYYDLYQLIERKDVQNFIGTPEYLSFKKEHFGREDLRVSNSDAFRLSKPEDKKTFEIEYGRSESLYFKGRPSLAEILTRLKRDLDRL